MIDLHEHKLAPEGRNAINNPYSRLRGGKMIRTVIVDDENKARKLLNNLVKKYCPQLDVVGLAASADEAYAMISKYNPEIIFLDIRMPEADNSGLLKKLEDKNIQIICTTAYDQYAIKAIRHGVVDYLLKPIDVQELKGAVQKAQNNIREVDKRNLINEEVKLFLKNFNGSSADKLLGLTTQSGINFVRLKDILYCKAEGNYTLIYLAHKKSKEIVTKTLKEFESLLSGHQFFRVHRSYLINLQHIKAYERSHQTEAYDGDGGCVILAEEVKVPVSRERRKYLLNHIAEPF